MPYPHCYYHCRLSSPSMNVTRVRWLFLFSSLSTSTFPHVRVCRACVCALGASHYPKMWCESPKPCFKRIVLERSIEFRFGSYASILAQAIASALSVRCSFTVSLAEKYKSIDPDSEHDGISIRFGPQPIRGRHRHRIVGKSAGLYCIGFPVGTYYDSSFVSKAWV